MRIQDRYAGAVHSSNLKSEPETYRSDSDVIAAYGLAAKRVLFDGRPGSPLAVALERLFAGDSRASREIVQAMAGLSWGKARTLKVKLTRVQSEDLARAVLAWHRDGKCKPCGGHGYDVVPGTRTVGDAECRACHGTTKMPFEPQFRPEHRDLARWLLTAIEKEQSVAGPAAMRALAPMLEI
jgi:hypothetical protein